MGRQLQKLFNTVAALLRACLLGLRIRRSVCTQDQSYGHAAEFGRTALRGPQDQRYAGIGQVIGLCHTDHRGHAVFDVTTVAIILGLYPSTLYIVGMLTSDAQPRALSKITGLSMSAYLVSQMLRRMSLYFFFLRCFVLGA